MYFCVSDPGKALETVQSDDNAVTMILGSAFGVLQVPQHPESSLVALYLPIYLKKNSSRFV